MTCALYITKWGIHMEYNIQQFIVSGSILSGGSSMSYIRTENYTAGKFWPCWSCQWIAFASLAGFALPLVLLRSIKEVNAKREVAETQRRSMTSSDVTVQQSSSKVAPTLTTSAQCLPQQQHQQHKQQQLHQHHQQHISTVSP